MSPALAVDKQITKSFPAFAWSVLIYNLAVIAWGALVRATSSGAGCGGHWPLCNGDVLPSVAQAATRIEFIHRMMSGVALIAVVALPIWAAKVYAKTHPARRWAVWSLVFMLTEALLGAALVLLGYVEKDQSTGRIISLSLHLINTFALLACLALTAWWSNIRPLPYGRGSVCDGHHRMANPTELQASASGRTPWNLKIAIAAVVLVSVAGAITALGDTLFPARTLVEGMRADFSTQANFLVRLRVIHPFLAVLTGFYVAALAFPQIKKQKLAAWLLAFVTLQLVAGGVNVMLSVPLTMQLLHLLIADGLWITLILFVNQSRFAAPVVLEPAQQTR